MEAKLHARLWIAHVLVRYRVTRYHTEHGLSLFDCCASCRPTVGAQLHQRGAATVNGTSSFAIFASKLLNMPPSTRANITVDDDAPDAGAAEQGASLQMLNIDTAVSAAVERTFESHRSEMVAQLLAALETREMRASRHDAAPPRVRTEDGSTPAHVRFARLLAAGR